MPYKILIAEENRGVAQAKKNCLEGHDFQVELVASGADILTVLFTTDYDLLILECNQHCKQICQQIRKKLSIPILLLLDQQEPPNILTEIEADAAILQSCTSDELVAQVRSCLKWYTQRVDLCIERPTVEKITCGNLMLLPYSRHIYKDGEEVRLSDWEFEMLRFLIEHPNRIFSKEQLFAEIWGDGYIRDSTSVLVYLNRIREKIEANPAHPQILETVEGIGYRLHIPK